MDSNEDERDFKIPIVYSRIYDIKFMGFERCHPFDAGKWGRIFDFLCEYSQNDEHNKITLKNIIEPYEISKQELLKVHTREYLDSLKWSKNVAMILEIFFIAILPNYIVDKKLLKKFRYQTGGTIKAAQAALKYGWAINLGGGFHHAHKSGGSGFCVYADITIAIENIRNIHPNFKFMIVDLDAHQGNGHERDFVNDKSVYILDIYNKNIFPHDTEAKKGISKKIELKSYTSDGEFLKYLEISLEDALKEFKPNFLVYNAGTDCLDGDPLGRLEVSPEGIKKRDRIMFEKAKSEQIPILMVTSGGYQRSNAEIIADSIWDMITDGVIGRQSHSWAPYKA